MDFDALDAAEALVNERYEDKRFGRRVDFPFNGDDYFGVYDLVHTGDEDATVVEVRTGIGDLKGAYGTAASQIGYLESRGFDVDYHLMVFDESVRSLVDWKETKATPYYTDSRLIEETELDEEALDKFYRADVVNDLNSFFHGEIEGGSDRFPKYDFDSLKERGLIKENGSSPTSTSKLNSLMLTSDDTFLHFTPRADILTHPDLF